MTKQEQLYKNYLKDFLKSGLSLCENEIDSSSKLYEKQIKKPIFQNNVLTGTTTITIIDYNKLLHTLKKRINKYPKTNSFFKVIKNIFKANIDNIESKNTFKIDIDYDELSSEQFFNFLFQYLMEYGTVFDNLKFKKILSKFENFISNDFFSYYYLTPLYNVEGDFPELQLSSNLWIKKIDNFEYSKIINLNNLPLKEILPHQKRLRYVIICKIIRKKKSNFVQTALENFENVVNTLKLFGQGNPQFGNLYTFSSRDWNVDGLELVERGHEKPASSKKCVLNSKSSKNFGVFFNNIFDDLLSLENSDFLYSSITRFGMSFHHRKPVDKIVDYVICLESLLVPNIGDATLKISHRLASLLGKNDDEILWIWNFMKTAYKFRSGYLHETKERAFTVNSQRMDLNIVSEKLEKFSKMALLRMIDLMEKYKSQKKIIEELDTAIYDRKKLDDLKKNFKH
jgi:hypothetical protein